MIIQGISFTYAFFSLSGQINISSFYFLDELYAIKDLMIGEYIWLNISKDDIDLIHKNLSLKNSMRPNFKKYEMVEIVDVIPYIIDEQNQVDFFLKIKSNNAVGFLKYDDFKKDTSNQIVRYFNQIPIYNYLGKSITENLIKGNVIINMTKFQVMVAWGKPKSIKRNAYGEKIYNYLGNKFVKYDESNRVLSFQSY